MNARFASRPLLAAVALIAGLVLTACGADTDAGAKSEPTAVTLPSDSATATAGAGESATPQAQGNAVEITVKGDQLTPNAGQVKVKVGDAVDLHITSDRAGELHLHTTPDQHIEFQAGETAATVKLTRPGRIELEEHESGKLLVQFVVQ